MKLLNFEGPETSQAHEDHISVRREFVDRATRCRIVESAADFAELEPDWRELSENCRWPSLFQSWEWASTWWKYFGEASQTSPDERGLCVIVVEEPETRLLLGIVPLHYKRSASPWTLKPRRLEVFGERGLEEVLGDEPILPLRRGYERAAVRAALQHLYASKRRIDWDFLSLKVPCRPGELLVDGPPTVEIARRSGWFWEQHSYPGRMVAELGSDWENYRRSLSKSMRDNTAYYPKRLIKHGRTASVEYITDADSLGPVVELLIELHGRRALDTRGFAHSDHLPGRSQQGMLQEILRLLAAQGKAFVAVLLIDGSPAAAQAFLRREGAIVFYFSGHEPRFAEYSPLTLLTMDVMKTAMAERCPIIDFLPGKVLWKERWGGVPEYDIEEFFCVSGTLRSRALACGRRMLSGRRKIGEKASKRPA